MSTRIMFRVEICAIWNFLWVPLIIIKNNHWNKFFRGIQHNYWVDKTITKFRALRHKQTSSSQISIRIPPCVSMTTERLLTGESNWTIDCTFTWTDPNWNELDNEKEKEKGSSGMNPLENRGVINSYRQQAT